METLDKKTKQTLVKKTIRLCWFALLGCTLIYLFGGHYFRVFIENENIKAFCDYIDNTFWKYIIKFICANFSFYLYTSSVISKKITLKQYAIIEIFIVLDILIKYINPVIGFMCDCILLVVIPFIFCVKNYKLKWAILRTFIGFVLLNVFQIISMLIKEIGIGILNTSILIELILQIDYYIMLILYYLYSVKLEGEWFMGQIGWLWFGSDMAMDRGYAKFIKVMALFGIIITFPISVPYLLWKKHKRNKVVKAKV